jgi:hypothetical protein
MTFSEEGLPSMAVRPQTSLRPVTIAFAQKFVLNYMGSKTYALRALYEDLPVNIFRFLCNQTSFRAKEAVAMIATEIVAATIPDEYILPTDPFDTPLTQTGRNVSDARSNIWPRPDRSGM